MQKIKHEIRNTKKNNHIAHNLLYINVCKDSQRKRARATESESTRKQEKFRKKE